MVDTYVVQNEENSNGSFFEIAVGRYATLALHGLMSGENWTASILSEVSSERDE